MRYHIAFPISSTLVLALGLLVDDAITDDKLTINDAFVVGLE